MNSNHPRRTAQEGRSAGFVARGLAAAGAFWTRLRRDDKTGGEDSDDQRFRGLIEANPAVILQIDPVSGRIRGASGAAVDFYGWPRETLCRMSIQDIREDDPRQVARERQSAVRGERSAFITRHRRADGSVRSVEVHASPVPLGRSVVLVSIIQDITQRVDQEARIAELLREQKAILDSRAVGLVKLVDRRCVWANVTAAEALGYHLDELIVLPTRLFFPKGDGEWEAFGESAYAALARGEVFRSEAKLIYRYSGARWFELSGASIGTGGGESLWTLVDINPRKEAEQALVAAMAESDDLYNKAATGYHSVGPDGLMLRMNDTELRWLGYTREEVIGRMTIADLLNPEDARRVPDLLDELAKAGRFSNVQIEYRRKDGSAMPALVNAVAVRDADGALLMAHATVMDWTERLRTETALQRESEKNLALLRNASDGIHILDENGDVLEASDSFCEMIGYPREQVIGMNVSRWDAGFDNPEELKAAVRRQFRSTRRAQFQTRHRRSDGTVFDVEVSGFPLELAGRPALFNASRDITERRRLESEREEALRRLQKIASRVPGVVYQYRLRPDGTACFPFASSGLRDIYRVDPEDVREDAGKVMEAVHPDDLEGLAASIAASARDLTPWRHEYRLRFGDAEVRWLFGDAMPEREADGGVLWHGYISDITERKKAESVIAELAFHDMLTRLPNRRLLADRLGRTMASSKRSHGHAALLVLDLDNFKAVNDTYGHAAGDALLTEVARRLLGGVRETDTVARVGGDEFVVILAGLDPDATLAVASARGVAEALCARLAEPFRLPVQADHRGAPFASHAGSVSIGATVFRGREATQDELLTRADRAMYEAKRLGGGKVMFDRPLTPAI